MMGDSAITAGLTGSMSIRVEKDDLASAYGNPGVDVYATPALLGLIEGVCLKAIDGRFDAQSKITVGARVEMDHLAPTPPGFTVTAESELIEVKGPKMVFKVEVRDDVETVARAVHTRFIIDRARFFANVEKKAAKV